MNILVTGGAGYIGSVIVEECLRHGHHTAVIDDLSRGHRDSVDKRAKLYVADIASAETVRDILEFEKIDVVIHMAAFSIVPESNADPRNYYSNNIEAGLHLLDAMLSSAVRKLVFSSTAAVYGEPGIVPITEDTVTVPSNVYGETKLAFERILQSYGVAYGLESISLRYFNAAGATDRCGEIHDPETHLIPLALETAAGERESLTVFGSDYPTTDGTCIRDYIHVRDLASAHLLAVANTSADALSYNLGIGHGYSVREIIDAVSRITERTLPLETAGRRNGDPAILIADATKIQRELGWKPQNSDLDSIICSAWEWKKRHSLG